MKPNFQSRELREMDDSELIEAFDDVQIWNRLSKADQMNLEKFVKNIKRADE